MSPIEFPDKIVQIEPGGSRTIVYRRGPEQTEPAEVNNVDAEPASASTIEFERPDDYSLEIAEEKRWTKVLNAQLLQAATLGELDEVDGLITQGANVNCIDDKDGQTPLHKACSSGLGIASQKLADTLIGHGAEVDTRDFLGHTPLLLACLAGEEYPIPSLIQAGADINAAHNSGAMLLHITAQQGKIELLKLILRGDVTVDVQNNAGRTALHEVALAGPESAEDAAELLLESGAFVDATDYWGNTPLHLSVFGKKVGVMAVLLKHEAVINHKNAIGETALHEACRLDFADGVDFLLRNGADKTMEDHNGKTPAQIATESRLAHVVALIDRHSLRTESSETTEEVVDSQSDGPPAETPPDRVQISIERPETEPAGENSDEAAVETEALNTEQLPELPNNIWTGVRRDNGDGFILANYDNHEISFDAKLESIVPCIHEGKDMHEIQLLINFMRPYSMDYRIRYAKVDILLSPKDPKETPHIRGIMPQADRMEVSDQEITSGQKFTVGAAGNGGPSSVNISMEGSKSRTATFKGVRIIHGAIRDRMHACWRMYEEPGSKSGLPEIVRLLMLVHCDTEFDIRLNLSVKACHFLTFGIPRTLTAPPGPSYTVPALNIITAMEQESRLRQVLDVANRAATVVEEAHKFETRFSEAIQHHAKKDLIMQAGKKESHLQEWTDILDASKSSDFRFLRDKLLEMRDTRFDPIRVERETIRLDRTERMWSPRDAERLAPRARVRERMPYEEHSTVDDWDYRRNYRRARDDVVDEYGGGHNPRSRNALQGFSAVGPGYHVSRLA